MVRFKTIARKKENRKDGKSLRKKGVAAAKSGVTGRSQPKTDSRFLTDLYKELYYSNYATRTIAVGRKIDLASFDENNAEFVREWFKFQKWDWLVDQQIPVYPDLVRLFYTHFDEANKKPGVIHTWVKGKAIRLDAEELGKILRLPSSGLEIQFKQSWDKFDGVDSNVCTQVLLRDSETLLERPEVDGLPFVSRLLLLFLQSTFISRLGRKSSLTSRDMKTMYCILKAKKINMPLFMINYMINAHNNTKKCCLPYAMWLTLVFRHFDVNLTNEVELCTSTRPFTIRTVTNDLRYGYDKEAGDWKHLGVRRAPKRKAEDFNSPTDDVLTDNAPGEKSKVDGEAADSSSYLKRALLESFVVQEMLKRLHPAYFTTECITAIRSTAAKHMMEEDDLQPGKAKTVDNEDAEPAFDGEEEEEDGDGGGGNYESLDEDN